MKRAVVVLALIACKSDKPAPAPTPGSASAVAPIVVDAGLTGPDVCKIGTAALAAATCEKPESNAQLAQAKKSFDGVASTVGQTSVDPAQLQIMCAQLLIALERDAKKLGCAVSIEDVRRTEIMATLDAWYARRTTVEKTGHAEADAVIAKIAAVRDATCACTLGTCLAEVDKQLLAVGTMPEAAPPAARTLGSKLLEDAARCANRVRLITDPPK